MMDQKEATVIENSLAKDESETRLKISENGNIDGWSTESANKASKDGSMNSFQAQEVSAWLKEEIRNSNNDKNTTQESKNICDASVHVEAVDVRGSNVESKSKLIEFVTCNGALVFWTNCVL